VVPAFCFDDRLLHGRHASGPRTQFLLECLADLDASLRARGSGLVLRHGPPERELPRLAREAGAGAIHLSADLGPFARRRDTRVAGCLPCRRGSRAGASPAFASWGSSRRSPTRCRVGRAPPAAA
jgi:deoxyribodipyrimidine photo-lyase